MKNNDAKNHHHFERANTHGGKIHDIDIDVLDSRTERFTRKREASFGAPSRSVPRKMIGGYDACGAAPFSFKGKIPVPRPDIEDGFAVERLGKVRAGDRKTTRLN